MNRNKGFFVGIIFAAASFAVFYFISPPFGNMQGDGGFFPGMNQGPGTVPTLTDDIDACVANPTSTCDQEMQQILDFCKNSKDPNIPACSDSRVQAYVDNRGLNRPTINIGQ